MSDYIEREAAIEAAKLAHKRIGNPYENIREVFDSIPAADVRPVVLCRDCEYFSDVMYGGMQFEYGYCDRWADGTRMNPDDFCSHAAKKEES